MRILLVSSRNEAPRERGPGQRIKGQFLRGEFGELERKGGEVLGKLKKHEVKQEAQGHELQKMQRSTGVRMGKGGG
jgi:hypothetical protein